MQQTKAAIYCRIDGGRSSEYMKEGMDSQQNRLNGYAEKNGFQIVGIYSDLGKNGISDDRPGLNQLFADANAGLFHTVLVLERNRLFRNSLQHPTLPFRLVSVLD